MAKNLKREWVSEDFSRYLDEVQKIVEKDTGSKVARTDITSIIATFRPVIKIPDDKKKRPSIFDF